MRFCQRKPFKRLAGESVWVGVGAPVESELPSSADPGIARILVESQSRRIIAVVVEVSLSVRCSWMNS